MIHARRCIVAAALAIATAASAHADDCDRARTQTTKNICADLQYQQADAVMTEAYQRAVDVARRIGPDHEEKVHQAQRAWIPFRDLTCEAVGARRDGSSMEDMVVSKCLMRVTRARTEDLTAYATMGSR